MTSFQNQKVSVPVPLRTVELLIPDSSLLTWVRRGILTLQQLLEGNALKSFLKIQEEFCIPATDYYLYLQISHLLGSLPSPDITLCRQGWSFFSEPSLSAKGTSLFYHLLQDKLTFYKSTPYQRWETDLGETYTPRQWQAAFKSIYQASKCANHWELAHKIALRWYLTPYRLSKFLPSHSPLCWRGCVGVGQIMHVFWSCKHLTSFWNKVFCTISDITGILTKPSPALAVLNLGIDLFPLDCRKIVTHILLAARLLIARKWKSNLSPNVSEVIDIVKQNFTYENLLAYKYGSKRIFDRQWQLWVLWAKDR